MLIQVQYLGQIKTYTSTHACTQTKYRAHAHKCTEMYTYEFNTIYNIHMHIHACTRTHMHTITHTQYTHMRHTHTITHSYDTHTGTHTHTQSHTHLLFERLLCLLLVSVQDVLQTLLVWSHGPQPFLCQLTCHLIPHLS